MNFYSTNLLLGSTPHCKSTDLFLNALRDATRRSIIPTRLCAWSIPIRSSGLRSGGHCISVATFTLRSPRFFVHLFPPSISISDAYPWIRPPLRTFADMRIPRPKYRWYRQLFDPRVNLVKSPLGRQLKLSQQFGTRIPSSNRCQCCLRSYSPLATHSSIILLKLSRSTPRSGSPTSAGSEALSFAISPTIVGPEQLLARQIMQVCSAE
ncbi:hypothetical protein C8R45DRAFT_555570 [Mycena sanguinolenta]|nr:hypothetical protein C8R45DRAFT_555570 [Mycena sanguinolenta]